MVQSFKISDDHEYVLDTSVVKGALLNYSKMMKEENPQSNEDYDSIHKVCFYVLSELFRAKIAVDIKKTIHTEYQLKVLDPYPNDYPAQWFTMMESRGKIVPKKIQWDKYCSREMRRRFGLSKVDCCLVYVADKASSRKVLHRDNGITNAAGYINKNFNVEQVNVMSVNLEKKMSK